MEQHQPPHEVDRGDTNDPIARLLKFAGSRPQPDAERSARFKSELRGEWQRVTDHRSQRRVYAWAATVAAGAAAAAAVFWLPAPTSRVPVERVVVARILRSEGPVRTASDIKKTPASWRSVRPGEEVTTGTPIETEGGGRTVLSLNAGMSLRIDEDSRVVLLGPAVVKLERGAIYVDSGSTKRQPILIQTRTGVVRDIGTQFEVRDRAESLRVRVREGEVLVESPAAQITARAGEALHFDRQGGYVRSSIPIFGDEWSWASAIAPQFQLEGSTVEQFLDWVVREQGWSWRFVDEDTARRASRIVTHGSIEGYTPEESLSIVLPTCGLSFERKAGEVMVSIAKESTRAR